MHRQPGALTDRRALRAPPSNRSRPSPRMCEAYSPPAPAAAAGERDDLVGPAEDARHVDEARREADRAFGHGVANQAAHPIQLVRGRCPPLEPEHLLSYRAVPDERCEVHRRASRIDRVEVVASTRPTRDAGSRPAPHRRARRPRPTPPTARGRSRSCPRRPTSPPGERCSASPGTAAATGRSGCARRRIPARRRGSSPPRVRDACGAVSSSDPTAAMRSPSTATQPGKGSAPVPSTIEPVSRRSAIGAR